MSLFQFKIYLGTKFSNIHRRTAQICTLREVYLLHAVFVSHLDMFILRGFYENPNNWTYIKTIVNFNAWYPYLSWFSAYLLSNSFQFRNNWLGLYCTVWIALEFTRVSCEWETSHKFTIYICAATKAHRASHLHLQGFDDKLLTKTRDAEIVNKTIPFFVALFSHIHICCWLSDRNKASRLRIKCNKFYNVSSQRERKRVRI